MLKTPIILCFLLYTANAFTPSDIFSFLQQPQVATIAKDYVVNSLAGPLSELRNTICSSPLLNEDKIISTLNNAADSLTSALADSGNFAPQLQNALSYVTQLGQEVMNDPSFKPQLESLQKQMEHTLDYLSENLDGVVSAASKAGSKIINKP